MKDDAIRRRHFQDSLLPRGLPTKELANRLLVRVPPRIRERARARVPVYPCARGGQVFVRFAINIKQDGDQEPYEYNSGHLQPSPSVRRMGAEARRYNNRMIVIWKIGGNGDNFLTSFFPIFSLKLHFILL